MDALHATQETLDMVREKHADFLVSVKGNRPELCSEATATLAGIRPVDLLIAKDNPKTEHGRCETRSIKVFPFVSSDPGLASIKTAMYVHRRTRTIKTGVVTEEDELYMASVYYSAKYAKEWLDVTRGHWHIENGLHYVKDRTMKEDRCVAQGTSAVNMASLRSVATHMLRSSTRYVQNASDAFKANAQLALDLVLRGIKPSIK